MTKYLPSFFQGCDNAQSSVINPSPPLPQIATEKRQADSTSIEGRLAPDRRKNSKATVSNWETHNVQSMPGRQEGASTQAADSAARQMTQHNQLLPPLKRPHGLRSSELPRVDSTDGRKSRQQQMEQGRSTKQQIQIAEDHPESLTQPHQRLPPIQRNCRPGTARRRLQDQGTRHQTRLQRQIPDTGKGKEQFPDTLEDQDRDILAQDKRMACLERYKVELKQKEQQATQELEQHKLGEKETTSLTSRAGSSTTSERKTQSEQTRKEPEKVSSPVHCIPRPPKGPKPSRAMRPGTARRLASIPHSNRVALDDTPLKEERSPILTTPSDSHDSKTSTGKDGINIQGREAVEKKEGEVFTGVENGSNINRETSPHSRSNEPGFRSESWNSRNPEAIQRRHVTPAYLMGTEEEGEDWPEWFNLNCQKPYSGKAQKWLTFDDDTHRMVMRWCLTRPPLRPSPLVRDLRLSDCRDSDNKSPKGGTSTQTEVSSSRSDCQPPLPNDSDEGHAMPNGSGVAVPNSETTLTRGLEPSSCGPERQQSPWDGIEQEYEKWRIYYKAQAKYTGIIEMEDDSRLRRYVGHKLLAEAIAGKPES